jgi:hypothetical protein
MFFCPKCNYSFDISKASDNEITEDTRVVLKRASDAFKKLEAGEDLNLYKADFKQDDLIKNVKYKKLSNDQKVLVNKLFEEITYIGVEFRCNNCNEVKTISETTLLYEYDINDTVDKIKTLDDNQLTTLNPILPRTHDYNCKNIDCLTNTKKHTKEAVFYRDKESYKINYICCVCFHNN